MYHTIYAPPVARNAPVSRPRWTCVIVGALSYLEAEVSRG